MPYARYYSLVLAYLLLTHCSPKMAVQNPFNQESADLPYYTEECATEFPYFLDRELIQKEVVTALKQKGILLKPNYLFQKDSISVLLDGYDPNNRIGYIWMHKGNLEFNLMDYSSVEDSILKEIQEWYKSKPSENLSSDEVQYFFEKQEKGELFIALINNFNPKYNLDFYELRNYRRKLSLKRKWYKEDYKGYDGSVAKFKQKKLAKRMKALVRDIEKYVDWCQNDIH